MRVLALDTTGRAGSVALVDDGRIVREQRRRCVAHARRAPAGRARSARRAVCRRSTSLPSPSVRDRSPACASASRRCRGWRWSTGGRSSACLGARGARPAGEPDRLGAGALVALLDRRAARRRVLRALPRGRGAACSRPNGWWSSKRRRSPTRSARSRTWSAYPVAVGDLRGRWRRALRDACCHAPESWLRLAAPMPIAGAIGCMAAVSAGARAGRAAGIGRTRSMSAGPTRSCTGTRSAPSLSPMTSCTIEPLSSRVADRRRSWRSRRRRSRARGRARCTSPSSTTPASRTSIWRERAAPRDRSASVPSGACSTSCTSTTSRCCRRIGGRASARRCCCACSETARSSARSRATLEVRRSNEPAQKLYEKFGFTVAGVRRRYYSNPIEDALVLWRDGLP